jgi:hypothetical protein
MFDDFGSRKLINIADELFDALSGLEKHLGQGTWLSWRDGRAGTVNIVGKPLIGLGRSITRRRGGPLGRLGHYGLRA